MFTRSVRKVSDFFFCENLVDLNEARLHEATLNLYTNTCIFSRLSITLVDGKQILIEVVVKYSFRIFIVRKVSDFFFVKTWWISMQRACMRRP